MAYYKLLLDKPARKTLIKLYFNFNIPLHSPGAWIYLHMSFCLLWECILAYIHSWKIGSCLHSCVRSRRWTQHIRRCLKNRAKTVKSLKLLYFTHKSWKVHSNAMVKCMYREKTINFPGWAKHKGRWVDDSTWYCTSQKVLIEVTLALSMFRCSIWTFNYNGYCFCVCYKKVQRNRIRVRVNHDVRSTCHSNRLSPKIVKMFLIIVSRGDWSWKSPSVKDTEEKALNFMFRVRSLWTICFCFCFFNCAWSK